MAFSAGGVIANPLLQFLYVMMSGQKQQRGADSANRANEERFNIGTQLGTDALQGGMAIYDSETQKALDALINSQNGARAGTQRLTDQVTGAMGDRTKDVLGQYDSATGKYASGLSAFLKQLSGDDDKILSGYGDRYKKAEADLQGYGDQQKADIDKDFAQREAAAIGNANERGWGNSGMTYGASTQIGGERSAEQRRLGDDLVRQRVGILSGLSGDQLSAQERLGSEKSGYKWGGLGQMFQNNAGRATMQQNLTGDEINALQQLGLFGVQNNQSMGGDLANFYGTNASNRANQWTTGLNNLQSWFGERNDQPPPQNNLPFMFGQNSVQAPHPPSGWESFIGGMAPGIGSGFGMGAASPGGLSHMFGHPLGWGA